MPGTLTAELGGRQLLIYVLDTEAPVVTGLRALEAFVAGLFALEWEIPHA